MLIGVTGGIGSGKSRVCHFWRDYFSLPSIDVDALCRQLLVRGAPGWHALHVHFGMRFFSEDKSLDRSRLREALFSDKELRCQVDGLLHPLARQAVKKKLTNLAHCQFVLLEIPLLYEAGWQEDVDRRVVVYATEEVRCRRIISRDRVSREQAMAAINAQISLTKKAMAADHVIENSGNWVFTSLQIFHLHRLFMAQGKNEEVFSARKCLTGTSEPNN